MSVAPNEIAGVFVAGSICDRANIHVASNQVGDIQVPQVIDLRIRQFESSNPGQVNPWKAMSDGCFACNVATFRWHILG